MAIAPAPSLFVVPFPFPPNQFDAGAREIFEINFLISKAGTITAGPGTLDEADALAGLVPDDVEALMKTP